VEGTSAANAAKNHKKQPYKPAWAFCSLPAVVALAHKWARVKPSWAHSFLTHPQPPPREGAIATFGRE